MSMSAAPAYPFVTKDQREAARSAMRGAKSVEAMKDLYSEAWELFSPHVLNDPLAACLSEFSVVVTEVAHMAEQQSVDDGKIAGALLSQIVSIAMEYASGIAERAKKAATTARETHASVVESAAEDFVANAFVSLSGRVPAEVRSLAGFRSAFGNAVMKYGVEVECREETGEEVSMSEEELARHLAAELATSPTPALSRAAASVAPTESTA